MVAVGNGARASIEEQVVAAGMNVITVVAGNYKMKGEDGGGGVVDHNARWEADPDFSVRPGQRRCPRRLCKQNSTRSHPEDDPDGEARSPDGASAARRFGRRAWVRPPR